MKIKVISDLHGIFPDESISDNCDVLLICGDICPTHNHSRNYQEHWIKTNFSYWCVFSRIPYIVFIAGNHDFIFENLPKHQYMLKNDNVYYLNDTSITINGISIYGTPWTPQFYDWAFMGDETLLASKFNKIPKNTDILLTHGPAFGYNDQILEFNDKRNIGSLALRNVIDNSIIKYHCFGHIHSANHEPILCKNNITKSVCVSYVNERYLPFYKPFEFEI